MSIVLTQPQKSSIEKDPANYIEVFEFIVSCPKCRTLETVQFTEDGLLVPTRKFSQKGAQIYHDCGTDEPCYLYRI